MKPNEDFGYNYLFLLGVLANVCQVMNFYKLDGMITNEQLQTSLDMQNKIYLEEILKRLDKIEAKLNGDS